MSNTVERDWTTASGLRAVCAVTTMGHRCGYVEIPEGHWLHGTEYSDETTVPMASLHKEEIGKRGPIDLVCMAGREVARGGDFFDVHGSITFSGDLTGYGIEGGFWYGFDCAHYMDREEPKSEAYVVAECERLAEQIAVKWAEQPA